MSAIPESELGPEHQTLLAEQKHQVQECLKYLSPREKQVIHGIFYRQLSVAEIAGELHCSKLCVSTAKYCALKKLRRIFEEQHVV